MSEHAGPARLPFAGVPINPWDLRHLLLTIDEHPRQDRDDKDLAGVVSRVVSALTLMPPSPMVKVPAKSTTPFMVVGQPLWLFETNAWLVAPDGRGGECVVIDVPGSPQVLIERIQNLDLRLAAVMLTHGHVDHVAGTKALLDGLGVRVPVYLHPADRLVVRRELRTVLSRVALDVFPLPRGALAPLPDGTEVTVGSATVRALHTPGHTPGSTCFLVEGGARPLLFTGDVLFAGGAGRCDLPGATPSEAGESLRSLITTLADDTVVLPGHGGLTTAGRERARLLAADALAESLAVEANA